VIDVRGWGIKGVKVRWLYIKEDMVIRVIGYKF
jgi:hypothetical protein